VCGILFSKRVPIPLGFAHVSETRRSASVEAVGFEPTFVRVGSIRADETRAHARSRTGSHRVRGGCSTIEKHGHERTRVSACGELLAPRRRELQRLLTHERARAPAGGIEPPRDRLTAGCLTIRLRWNEWPARNVRDGPSAPGFQRAWAAHGCPCLAWFRAQESNLRFWIQRPASCQLDDPGVTRETCRDESGVREAHVAR
jgi:hypothetical protein